MKIAPIAQLAFIGIAATAVYTFVTVARHAEARRACVPLCAMHPAYAAMARTAPDFELRDMRGVPVKLSSFRGKTVVLNFWTRTCRPCLEEMPSLSDLAKVLATRKDVVMLTVTTEAGPDAVRDTLKSILQTDAPPFAVLFDGESKVVGDAYGTHLFPETWIIDPQGVIRARFDGARDWSTSLVLDLIDTITRPTTCPIEFKAGVMSGVGTSLCDDIGSEG